MPQIEHDPHELPDTWQEAKAHLTEQHDTERHRLGGSLSFLLSSQQDEVSGYLRRDHDMQHRFDQADELLRRAAEALSKLAVYDSELAHDLWAKWAATLIVELPVRKLVGGPPGPPAPPGPPGPPAEY